MLFSVRISKVKYILYIDIININKKKSLTLLNEKALNEDFKVEVFVVQKLIKKKEVKPISSQPKYNIIRFPEDTKNNILTTKESKNNKNLSTKGSYLKYENAYIYTNNAIVVVNNIKLNDIESIKK